MPVATDFSLGKQPEQLVSLDLSMASVWEALAPMASDLEPQASLASALVSEQIVPH